jgi:hypothetical protein
MNDARKFLQQLYEKDLAYRKGETLEWLDDALADSNAAMEQPSPDEQVEPPAAVSGTDDDAGPEIPENEPFLADGVDVPDPAVIDTEQIEVPDANTEPIEQSAAPEMSVESNDDFTAPDEAAFESPDEAPPAEQDEVEPSEVSFPGSAIADFGDVESPDMTVDEQETMRPPEQSFTIEDKPPITQQQADDYAAGVDHPTLTNEERSERQFRQREQASRALAQQLAEELGPGLDEMKDIYAHEARSYMDSQLLLANMLRIH